ncbi:MAG: hypothetical protein RQ833_08495 [Sphingomonadaceae bacterium]|nr:hypothetical protein [Sphingomonadaceae bacterium]
MVLSPSAARQKWLRDWHRYFSLLFAPMLLVFALSGGIMVFRLNEARPGEPQPPALIQRLGSLHKNARLALPRPRGDAAKQRSAAAPRAAAGRESRRDGVAVTALKAFFVLGSLGLFVTTVLGAWVGVAHARNRRLAWSLLAAGAIIPAALLAAAAR